MSRSSPCFFRRGLMTGYLRELGITPSFNEVLIILVIMGRNSSRQSITNHVGRGSGQECLGAIFFISLRTSCIPKLVNLLKGSLVKVKGVASKVVLID